MRSNRETIEEKKKGTFSDPEIRCLKDFVVVRLRPRAVHRQISQSNKTFHNAKSQLEEISSEN